jgi:hypothetical protein
MVTLTAWQFPELTHFSFWHSTGGHSVNTRQVRGFTLYTSTQHRRPFCKHTTGEGVYIIYRYKALVAFMYVNDRNS